MDTNNIIENQRITIKDIWRSIKEFGSSQKDDYENELNKKIKLIFESENKETIKELEKSMQPLVTKSQKTRKRMNADIISTGEKANELPSTETKDIQESYEKE